MADYIHPDSLEYKLKLGRVPSEQSEGILWRGMSGGEYKNLLEQGFLASKGEYNIGESQKGLTIFSTNPRTAEMYAHDFAPRDFKATPESPAYVVGIRKPSDSVPQQGASGSEFGVHGQIPLEDIIKVYRGNVFRPKSDTSRAVLDWQEVPVSGLSEASDYSGFEKVPALIDAAAAASQLSQTPTDEPRPKGKGQMFRGIGSLMRRRMFPIVQGAQLGWKTLTPEQRQGAQDFLNTPMHELVGMEKPGIEYFKDLLGLSSTETDGGIMSLPDLTKPAPVYSSAVSDAVNALSMERGDAAQIRSTIANTPGVKPEEMKYQLDKFLEGKGKVTKQEIQDFIADNPVTINDTILSDIDKQRETMTWEEGETYGLRELQLRNPEFGYSIIKERRSVPRKFNRFTIRYAVTDPAGKMLARHYDTLEEAKIQAQVHAVEQGYIRDDVTQFGKWTLGRGELNDNYREILMKLPTRTGAETNVKRYEELNNIAARRNLTDSETEEMIAIERAEFSGESGTAGEDFVSGHFRDKNVFAHLRVNDKVDDAGNDVLFVEEFQSDWHQKARKFRNDEIERIAKDQWDKWLSEEVYANIDSIREGIPYESVWRHDAGWNQNRDRFIKQAEKQVPEDFGYWTEADEVRMEELKAERIYHTRHRQLYPARLLDEMNAIGRSVPDAPFKKTWHELAFRRALRLAAEEGKDMVAWTNGDMQVERYNLRGEEAEGMRKFYDGIIKNYANKFGKKFGAKVGKIDVGSDLTDSGRREIGSLEAWMLEITPEMRRHLLGKGIQKFTHGGFVDRPLYEDARMIG